MSADNFICHILLALDASGSMLHRKRELMEVVDKLTAQYANRSEELKLETRVTIVQFDDVVECLIFDMDVLRLPSIKELYHIDGMTALVPATIQSITELGETAQRYGKHGFFVTVVTDGGGNIGNERRHELIRLIAGLPENWTLATLVPNADGAAAAAQLGFSPANIAQWSTTDAHGIQRVGQAIQDASNTYMTNLSRGIYTANVFSTGAENVNAKTVSQLVPLDQAKYELLPVDFQREIRDFVEANGRTYVPGTCFYQLNKSEEISGSKKLLVQEVATGQVFGPDGVRDLIGLGDVTRRVRPTFNPAYRIFPQSTSMNRHLMPNTNLLRML